MYLNVSYRRIQTTVASSNFFLCSHLKAEVLNRASGSSRCRLTIRDSRFCFSLKFSMGLIFLNPFQTLILNTFVPCVGQTHRISSHQSTHLHLNYVASWLNARDSGWQYLNGWMEVFLLMVSQRGNESDPEWKNPYCIIVIVITIIIIT